VVSADPLADTPERAAFRTALRSLIERESPVERVLELDRAHTFDDALHRRLGELGVLALGAPPEHGGAGDVRDQVVAVEELAAGPTSMAVFLIVHYMALQLLSEHGSPAQRETLLASLVTGETRIAFALTESGGGTDVARAMRTRAVPDGGGWVLSGTKLWTSGALRADALLVLARTDQEEGEGARAGIDGITIFVVPRSADGVTVTELDTLGVHSLDTCEVVLDGVRLEGEAVLGLTGRGFRHVLATLNRERLNVAAGALGAGRGALEAAVAYAREREAFGRPIGAFQAVQHALVDGAIALESARGLIVRAAEIEAAGGRADLLASMAKVAASEAAVRITSEGMHLMGGFGYSLNFPMQRWFRDVRLWTFAPLANEMLRNHLGERMLGLPRSF
jgi:acyl-CoA dehydrogenase